MGFSYSNWPQNRPKKNRHRSCNKKERSCSTTDFAFPFDHRVKEKERWSLCGTVSSFSAWRGGILLSSPVGYPCCKEVVLVPIVIGSPGTVSERFHQYLKESRTWPKYVAIKILFTGKILAVFLKERWWTPKATGGHMVPGNDLVGRPRKPCEW